MSGIAQGIGDGVNFSAQTPLRATNRFLFGCTLLGESTMLVSPNNRGTNQGIFVIGIRCQCLKHLLPHACLRPTALSEYEPQDLRNWHRLGKCTCPSGSIANSNSSGVENSVRGALRVSKAFHVVALVKSDRSDATGTWQASALILTLW